MTDGCILVVDDNPNNLSVVSQALRSVGWHVRIATDGEDALSKVANYTPDLILLDVQMPKMDGFEVCQRLKANAATAEIPIIFMTALADTTSKVKGLLLGAVDYIVKPFEKEETIARVRNHLQLRQLTQTLEQQVEDRTQQLTDAIMALQQAQLQTIQTEKMSALGNLIAGVAHEINNPVGCIVGNITVAETTIQSLFKVIELYQQRLPQPDAELQAEVEAIDLDYLREDLPKLIKAMQDSGYRIKSLSHSLRTFSRSDSDQKQPFNLHEGIDSTLLILRHRLQANEQRPDIEVVTEYGEIPVVQCFPGQLNQVFMNILANAIDAFGDYNQGRSFTEIQANPNRITIQTSVNDDQVKVAIADNGPGIPDEVKDHIFNHLFTTKSVGKGTGLGLAIARQIVVEKHGGRLDAQSELGQGTVFLMVLPVQG